jgi:hypothetical protein
MNQFQVIMGWAGREIRVRSTLGRAFSQLKDGVSAESTMIDADRDTDETTSIDNRETSTQSARSAHAPVQRA